MEGMSVTNIWMAGVVGMMLVFGVIALIGVRLEQARNTLVTKAVTLPVAKMTNSYESKKVVIIGAGLMGCGIAQVFASKGIANRYLRPHPSGA